MVAGVSVQTYGTLERGMAPDGRYANPTLMTLLRVMDALELSATVQLAALPPIATQPRLVRVPMSRS